MSTGNLALDIIINKIVEDNAAETNDGLEYLKQRYSCLTEEQLQEIYSMISEASVLNQETTSSLVITAPPSFRLKAKSTRNTIKDIINNAEKSILLTGYSVSDYFSDIVDEIIQKSQSGVFVRFFVNDIDSQTNIDKLMRYKGKFLKIYNYPKKEEDKMSALHAKVICVDEQFTLVTSANLSYHGQEGNVEIGTLIDSTETGKQISDLFNKLVSSRVFVAVK